MVIKNNPRQKVRLAKQSYPKISKNIEIACSQIIS
jgi:hypothetical protein